MSGNTLRLLSAQRFTHSIPLAAKSGVRMWAEFFVSDCGAAVRYCVRRGSSTGLHYHLADACEDFDGTRVVTTFVVEGR